MASSRVDSLISAVTRIGTAADPRKSYAFAQRPPLTPQEADALFNSYDIAYAVCCLIPEEALSEPWLLQTSEEDADLKERISDRMEDLGAVSEITDAAVFGRVFGDCFVYVAVDDGAVSEAMPLVPERVRSVRFLRKIERDKLSVSTKYQDPTQKNFGEVDVYQLSNDLGGTSYIHETRFLKFTGARTSERDRRANSMWHRSVLDKIWETLRDFGITWSAASLLVSQGTQGKYKLKDLAMLLAAPSDEGRQALSERIGMVDFTRGVLNSIILDADAEDFTYEVAPLTSLPELLDRFAARLSAAAGGIPVTKLFGISPAGMNATGESDAKNWYRILDAYRRNQIQPQVEKLLELLLIEAKQPDAEISVAWLPLNQPSDLEEAQRRATLVTADVALVAQGVLTNDEVAEARFGRKDGFDQEIRIKDRAERAVSEPELDVDTDIGGSVGGTGMGPDLAAQDTALNGAQVTSLLEVITAVVDGKLPRDTAVQIVVLAFNKSPEEANRLLGTVGRGFVPEKSEPEPAQGGFGRPAAPLPKPDADE